MAAIQWETPSGCQYVWRASENSTERDQYDGLPRIEFTLKIAAYNAVDDDTRSIWEPKLDGLTITHYLYVSKYADEPRRVYDSQYEVGFDSHGLVKADKAEAYHWTLARIQRYLERLVRAGAGDPASFGQYVQRVCAALDLNRIVEQAQPYRATWPSGYRFKESSVSGYAYRVDARIEEWTRAHAAADSAALATG